MNGDGGRQRSLGPGVNFDWSPDGKRLAVLRDDGIYIVEIKGGAARRVARGVQVDWSPDGRKIAFSRGSAVNVVNADGRGMRRLTAPPRSTRDSGPDWSPDGRKIAWVRTFDRDGDELRQPFVMNADGSGQRKLAAKVDPYSVSWSPDGRRLVADCWVGDYYGYYDIYVIDADGSPLRNLTPASDNDSSPAWSPDGEQIAFTSQAGPDSDDEIHVIGRDGAGRRRLTRVRGVDSAADWSSDGRSIAFISERDGNFDIYVMTPGGRRQTNLTRGARGVHNSHPAWSP